MITLKDFENKVLLRSTEVAKIFGISDSDFRASRLKGRLLNGPHPKYYKFGPKKFRYLKEDIEEWEKKYGIRLIEEGNRLKSKEAEKAEEVA